MVWNRSCSGFLFGPLSGRLGRRLAPRQVRKGCAFFPDLNDYGQALAALSASLPERRRSLAPKIISSENAVGSAIRML